MENQQLTFKPQDFDHQGCVDVLQEGLKAYCCSDTWNNIPTGKREEIFYLHRMMMNIMNNVENQRIVSLKATG